MKTKCENSNCNCDGKCKVCQCSEIAAVAVQSKGEEKKAERTAK